MEIFLNEENVFDQGEKMFRKTSLFVKNFLDQGKIFVNGRSRKNFCLWKTSLIKKKSLLVENFLDCGQKIRCNNFEIKC